MLNQEIRKKINLVLMSIVFVVAMVSRASAGPVLCETGCGWVFNVDGTVYDDAVDDPTGLPAYFDYSAFNWVTGLGTLNITLTSGSYFGAFFDHEIYGVGDPLWINEYGAATGSAASVQTWEIDEPEFIWGDIYTNINLAALDNSNTIPFGSDPTGDGITGDDVSMALAWNFVLNPGDTAEISLILSNSIVPSGFYLSQTDYPSGETIYFSSSLNIIPDGSRPVPEPGTLILLGSGLAGLALIRRRFIQRRSDS